MTTTDDQIDKDDATSLALCGLTERQINERHRRLRGSDALKYPRRMFACKSLCQQGDDPDTEHHMHQCFLQPGHAGDHEYSTQCRLMGVAND